MWSWQFPLFPFFNMTTPSTGTNPCGHVRFATPGLFFLYLYSLSQLCRHAPVHPCSIWPTVGFSGRLTVKTPAAKNWKTPLAMGKRDRIFAVFLQCLHKYVNAFCVPMRRFFLTISGHNIIFCKNGKGQNYLGRLLLPSITLLISWPAVIGCQRDMNLPNGSLAAIKKIIIIIIDKVLHFSKSVQKVFVEVGL